MSAYETNSERTLIGPLTTTFTPPGHCDLAFVDSSSSNEWLLRGQTCTYTYLGDFDSDATFVVDDTSCWPAAVPVGLRVTATPPLNGWGFYSPGLICPIGYTTACSATGGGPWDWRAQYSIYNGETAYGCCRRGFTCYDQLPEGQTCISTITSGQSTTIFSCFLGEHVITTRLPPYVSTATVSSSVSLLTVSGITIYAPMIEIRRQSTDAATLTTTSATPTEVPQKPSTLSTGAKAAIGVSIPVVVLILALFAAILLWRRRRANPTAAAPLSDDAPAGLPARDSLRQLALVEMSSTRELQEMETNLPKEHERHELDGS